MKPSSPPLLLSLLLIPALTSAYVELTPFVDPLPIPGRLSSPPSATITITMAAGTQKLHRDLPPTPLWMYNGVFPGPTIEAESGEPLRVVWANNLPAEQPFSSAIDLCAHGPNFWRNATRAVPHVHGGVIPARHDGHPDYEFRPGRSDTYLYPNNQPAATLWYHDHALGITRLNIYLGLVGLFLVRSAAERALELPAHQFDVPLVMADREFDADGSLVYPDWSANHLTFPTMLVNGMVWPFHEVVPGKYRFRLLNACNSRSLLLSLKRALPDGGVEMVPMAQIATDGGLLEAPVALTEVALGPAERAEIVVDFAVFTPGTVIELANADSGQGGLSGYKSGAARVVQFRVVSPTGTSPAPHTAPLPSSLNGVPAPIPPPTTLAALTTRTITATRTSKTCGSVVWSLDNLGFDDITELVPAGATEIWVFKNPTGNDHPMHLHLAKFRILDRQAISTSPSAEPTGEPWAPELFEAGWKDVAVVHRFEQVRVLAEFPALPGRYPYHCHSLEHEDAEMMRQFRVVQTACNADGRCDPGEDCISCPADCARFPSTTCGNGLCEAGAGETCASCAIDCAGDPATPSLCCGTPELGCDHAMCIEGGAFCRESAAEPTCCGDSVCEGPEGETVGKCAVDCPILPPQDMTPFVLVHESGGRAWSGSSGRRFRSAFDDRYFLFSLERAGGDMATAKAAREQGEHACALMPVCVGLYVRRLEDKILVRGVSNIARSVADRENSISLAKPPGFDAAAYSASAFELRYASRPDADPSTRLRFRYAYRKTVRTWRAKMPASATEAEAVEACSRLCGAQSPSQCAGFVVLGKYGGLICRGLNSIDGGATHTTEHILSFARV